MTQHFRAPLLVLVVVIPAGVASADVVYAPVTPKEPGRYLQVVGQWGELELGQIAGARRRLAVAEPSPLAPPLGDEAAKLAYYTPPLRGFEVGASYTPMPRGAADTPNPREARHMVEVAVRKKARVGNARARLTAGTSRARVKPGSQRAARQSWIAGAQIDWQAVRLDSDLRQQVTADGAAIRSWNTAFAYGAGDVTLSLHLRRSWVEGEPVRDLYQADASYRLSPRWQVVADTNIISGGAVPEAVVTVGTRLLF